MVKALPIRKDGIYSALVTPLTSDGNIAYDALRPLIRYELSHGAEGFYCCGSSGEGLLLDENERKKVMDVLSDEVSGKVPFIVHTGSLSTREAIALSRHAEECGAAAVSMIPPIYYHYTPEEVATYYEDVIHNVGLGVIVYNIPQFTGISFSKENSMMKDPRVVGIKHTSMNLYELERISQAFPEKTLFNGFDEIWLYSQSAGATATIGTTVNICPRLYAAIRDCFKERKITEAQALQHKANDFIEALVKVGIFPATKYCMKLLGVDVGICRRPFLPLDKKGEKMVEIALSSVSEYL